MATDDDLQLDATASAPGVERPAELEDTALAPADANAATLAAEASQSVELEATLAAEASISAELEPTLAAPRTERSASSSTTRRAEVGRAARRLRWARALFIAVATAGAINTIYFLLRFVVSASPPRLTARFLGAAHAANGAFGATSIFQGPRLTLARIALIGTAFVAIGIWFALQNRRDPKLLLFSAFGVITGQFSMSVAVLTSSTTLPLWRASAACWYVLMPAGALALLALFPSGRPVPRWSMKVFVVAIIPIVAQAVDMLRFRAYSVPLAGAGLASAVVFLGFQRHRYRHHATLGEQHQIKWLAYAAAVFLAIQIVAVITILPLLRDIHRPGFQLLRLLYEFLLAASYLIALACVMFSAARYRLWAIDRVINRTVVYVLVTGIVGGALAVAFFALDATLRGLFSASRPVALVVSLAAAVPAFVPTRRRIARWIDRRFYGIGLDYEGLAEKAIRAVALPEVSAELGVYDELVLVGRGGMGAVYRARHAELGVPVALKVMSPELAGDDDAQLRFRREAQILEGVTHPNVIPFVASGHQKGLSFIAMHYVEGEDLSAVLRRQGRLTIDEVAPVIAGVADALERRARARDRAPRHQARQHPARGYAPRADQRAPGLRHGLRGRPLRRRRAR